MRKLKLDVEALEVQSFATRSRSDGEGTVLGRSGWAGCFTFVAECPTGPSDCRCLPSIDVCGSPDCPSNGCGTDWDTCARSCQTCEGQETCPPVP
jgi:hypothetical protein